jgi:hypothetical protein
MRAEAESQHDVHGAPGAALPEGRSGQAGQPRQPREEGQRQMVVRGIELVAVARFLGSRRFLERVVVGAIGLAALASLARENQARTLARVAAWDRRRGRYVRPAARTRRAAR